LSESGGSGGKDGQDRLLGKNFWKEFLAMIDTLMPVIAMERKRLWQSVLRYD